jgi:hypothetical protein
VDVALSADPRIKRIKQEEKEAREAKRKNKAGPGGAPSKAQLEEEKRRAEEEAKAKEETEKVRVLHRVLVSSFSLTIIVGCEGRSKEGEGSGCQCREESTPCCEGRERCC